MPDFVVPAGREEEPSEQEEQWVNVDRKFAGGWSGGTAILLEDVINDDSGVVQAVVDQGRYRRYRVQRRGVT